MKKRTQPKEVLHPDDKFFSVLMRETENARAYLTNFYPTLSEKLDLDSLELEDTTFVNPQFKLFDSDIVYRCRFKHSSEQLHFSLLWEHKTIPEREVAIQIGLYLFQALYKLVKDKDKELEPVIPLLFYNGKEGWEPKTIKELFDPHPFFDTFKPFLPNFTFLFKNITNTPHEELMAIKERFFRSAMIAMANRYKADLLIEHISIIFEEDDQDRLKSIATYFFAIIERSTESIKQTVDNLEFTTKSKLMSTLTLLRLEGREAGRLEGRKEGRLEGKEEGRLEGIIEGLKLGEEKAAYKKDILVIRNMTLEKISVDLIAKILEIKPSSIKKIQKDLKKEPKILAALLKKQNPEQIAKSLKLTVWFVEVIAEIAKKKK